MALNHTYLDEPVIIDGTKIGLTPKGLKQMIKHYENCLQISNSSQMDDKARAHCRSIIEKYKIHSAIYKAKGIK